MSRNKPISKITMPKTPKNPVKTPSAVVLVRVK